MKKKLLKNASVVALCSAMLLGCTANEPDGEIVGTDWRTYEGFIYDTYNHDSEVKVCVGVYADGIAAYYDQNVKEQYQCVVYPYATTDAAKTVSSYVSGDFNEDGYTDISVVLVDEEANEVTTQWVWNAETKVFDIVEAEKKAPEVYLRDVFEEHGMKVGTCLTTKMISNDIGSERITSQFSSVTMENDMKPDYIFNKKASKDAGQLVVEFNDNMVKMLDWAVENDMAVRGHTLVWYSQTPAWIFYNDFDMTKGLVSKEVMTERLEAYIKQIFEKLEEAGYTEVIYAYDVVNEAWMEDGSIRQDNNLWYKTMGEDFLYYAFYYADMYAPESIDLYYNDYNEQYKANTIVNFVETLKDDNGRYLIDGIGLQAHLYTSDDLTTYFNAVDTIAATGLKVEITELDVSLGAWQNTLPASDDNLQKQGRFYYNLVNGIFERVDNGTLNMDALTFWGYNDSQSWRSSASPLLFNAVYQPKYAFYGAAQIKEYAGF